MRLLIGLGNKARHGKDSAALAIQTYFNAQFPDLLEARIFRFADALYEVCRREYGMTDKDAPLLQRIGAERRRGNPTYWIDQLRNTIGDFRGVVLIPDTRYQNEAAWIRSFGGFLINVTRLNEDGDLFVAPDRDSNHLSEIDLDGHRFDGYIKSYTGQEPLAAEQAITLARYFYKITEKPKDESQRLFAGMSHS